MADGFSLPLRNSGNQIKDFVNDLFQQYENDDLDNAGCNRIQIDPAAPVPGEDDVAIEEGATMVRIGTAIFGKRNY